jgi:hypothetical protein
MANEFIPNEDTIEDDRRAYQRFSINQLVEMDLGRESFIMAEGLNISENGILCASVEQCGLHEKVFLMMTLPLASGDRVIKCEGLVMRSEYNGASWDTGIMFGDLDEDCTGALNEFLGRLPLSGDEADATTDND